MRANRDSVGVLLRHGECLQNEVAKMENKEGLQCELANKWRGKEGAGTKHTHNNMTRISVKIQVTGLKQYSE